MTELTVDTRVDIEGRSFPIVSCWLREGLSRLTHAKLEVASTDDVDVAPFVGGKARVEIVVDGEVRRYWSLVVGRMGFTRVEEGSLRYELELHCPLWLQRHTRNLRKYRKMSSKDIISKVLDEGGVPHRWQISRTPPERKYCVQYRESNLDFVRRLLEFEGIFFTTDADGELVLDDTSAAAPAVAGKSSFELLEHEGSLEGGELGIHAFGKGGRVRSGTATVNDFNWKTPKVDLLKSRSAELDSELETYSYPEGYRKPDQGAFFAQIRLEAHRADASYVRGRGNVASFGPGQKFTFEGRFGGEYLLTEVEHEIHDPAYGAVSATGQQTTYQNRFEGIPLGVPYRPPSVTPRPAVQGAHTAMVRGPVGEEIHTDRYGRFRAQFHWDREATGSDEDSRWVRKCQESASSMNLARVGWEVSMVYIDGDPDRPVGLARDINGVMMPSYGQPANKTVLTIKTPTYPANGGFNELKMDDLAGSQLMYWQAERDLVGLVRNDRTETVGNNHVHNVGGKMSRSVTHDQTVTVGANSTLTVGGNLAENVQQNRTVSIGGNQNIATSDSLRESSQSNDTESVGAVRLTIAGAPSLPSVSGLASQAASAVSGMLSGGGGGGMSSPISLMGSIGRTAHLVLSRTVGGVYLQASADNIQTTGQFLLAETIGGAKLTASLEGSIGQTVDGPMALTVGGLLMRKSEGDMGVGSENSTVTVGASASFKSEERLEVQGKQITIEGLSKLELKSGDDLLILLEPSLTTVEGPLKLTADSSITVTGNKDNLTKA